MTPQIPMHESDCQDMAVRHAPGAGPRFEARARMRLEEAERRLLAAKAAACFYGLEFLNGRLLDAERLEALSQRILLAEADYRAARAALARILPKAPRQALALPEALEFFLEEVECLSRAHGRTTSSWPRAELVAMAEEVIAHTPA